MSYTCTSDTINKHSGKAARIIYICQIIYKKVQKREVDISINSLTKKTLT